MEDQVFPQTAVFRSRLIFYSVFARYSFYQANIFHASVWKGKKFLKKGLENYLRCINEIQRMNDYV